MEKEIHYELKQGESSWKFTFKYGTASSWLEIPSDMRGYHARSKEQYDWLKEGLTDLELITKLEEVWSSAWEGKLALIQQIEQWLQKQGAKALPFS